MSKKSKDRLRGPALRDHTTYPSTSFLTYLCNDAVAHQTLIICEIRHFCHSLNTVSLTGLPIPCRKVCLNCRCGKAEHNVVDDHDPGFYFVGKIFDRPLRSRREEMEFCYGHVEEEDDDDDGVAAVGSNAKRNGAAARSKGQGKTVRFDWIPPNVSKTLVSSRTASGKCRGIPSSPTSPPGLQTSALPSREKGGVQSGSNWQGFIKHDSPSSKLGSVRGRTEAKRSSNRAKSRARPRPSPKFA